MSKMLRFQLKYDNITEYFWTDSEIVLCYLRNDAKRFHIYVANRIQQIKNSLKVLTIPRLELNAALLAVKMSKMLRFQLKYDNITEYFWTDSEIVLCYLRNDAKRFHIYVANRIQQIKNSTTIDQWQHVKSENNPADCTPMIQK